MPGTIGFCGDVVWALIGRLYKPTNTYRSLYVCRNAIQRMCSGVLMSRIVECEYNMPCHGVLD
jgi:hypothetical protein